MDVSSLISPSRLSRDAREVFDRVASCEQQVVWRPRASGGRPVRARQSRALALVTENPVVDDYLDGRSSRYNARTASSATGKPCNALHADQQIDDASRSASQLLSESYSASTLSWHQKCKLPPMTAAIDRPQTVQYLRDFVVGSRRRPRTHAGLRGAQGQSFESLQRRHREFIATEVIVTHQHALKQGESASMADLFAAHALLDNDASDDDRKRDQQSADISLLNISDDLAQNQEIDIDPSLELATAPSGTRENAEKPMQADRSNADADDGEEPVTDPATIRRLRIESERAYQQRRAEEIRQERLRNQHRRWAAQDLADERRQRKRDLRDAKWRAERSVHLALQNVEKEARARAVKVMKDEKRVLQERREQEARSWHLEMSQRVTNLRQHRQQARSQALGTPQGMRSPVKLKESTIAAQDFLGPSGAYDLMQSSMFSSKEFPPAHQSNREILGGGFNRAVELSRPWQRIAASRYDPQR